MWQKSVKNRKVPMDKTTCENIELVFLGQCTATFSVSLQVLNRKRIKDERSSKQNS